MAAAVAVPLSTINSELGGVLPPSAVVQHSPRHGRSRAMSMKGKGGRQRGYSVVEDRDVTIAKALMFVVKRAIQKEDVEEGDEGEYLVADPEGWVSVADVLAHSRLSALGATFDDIRRVIANAPKPRFDLRKASNADAEPEEPAAWQVSRITHKETTASPVPVGDKLTADSPDLPEFVIYETSYQRYPLLLALGAITRAPGGSEYRAFVPVTVDEEGNESRQHAGAGDAAEISIWIHLRTALQAEPSIAWRRSESGAIVTVDDVPKSLWNKAIARRPEIGILFEDGEVRKEVPANLRGKGAKGKTRKGKGALKQEGSGDDSGSASEE
ncbi:hypothetical protein MYCTH_2307835 [Thermothelomyces thermophilus ATCC 42464]|uniref:2'-phosphotransferase n=1 Tax=Thermothelomyces thermophilus (strain ATCC 42464 / BCRC 31852 / DSM 1799) TaxID=573729 RepID=G2QIA5_THET4|nr:uncharacterized protein MYCTH_2307835 [Thermothelomyces thermophilus ATCC 42464]AEO59486.1 hypothetical protein MYCTH_2307835 [Thermothelomyces thermophilus ATCC 42464]